MNGPQSCLAALAPGWAAMSSRYDPSPKAGDGHLRHAVGVLAAVLGSDADTGERFGKRGQVPPGHCDVIDFQIHGK